MAGKPVRPRPQSPAPSSAGELADFLQQATELKPSVAQGRLIFAMDATASREPSWRQARAIQMRMFQETAALGGLRLQLCFYRGMVECRCSGWIDQAEELARLMGAVRCEAGLTQIRKLLEHARTEARKQPVSALVMVLDCMEEDPDKLAGLAGELGLLRVPVFVFQEGFEPIAERVFRDIARLSGGAFSRFDADSPEQLRQLLTAVAVYAAGGRKALAARDGELAGLLARQLR